jgi:TatD DNase family protein
LNGERVIQDGVDTQGRHPWYLRTLPTQKLKNSKTFLAIGESGLDRLCDTPYNLQLQVFREEVNLSEQLRKPLFLHCVRAIDDILRIRKELNAQQPCIWHGYRGNAQQLHQLLAHNFYFSFGLKYNTEALLACPLDRLLLETDDDTQHPISELYTEVANLRKISVEELIKQMHSNFRTLFLE